MRSVGVADVEAHGAAVRRRRAELRREHVEAARDRLRAELGAEVAGAAGDEEPHRTIVTGPSFTSSTSMLRAEDAALRPARPAPASASQKRS